MEQTNLDSKLRIKCNKLQDQVKKLNDQMMKKNEDMALLRQKADGSIQTNKFRIENEKLKKTIDKTTQRLYVLEQNETKRKQYDDIRQQLELTMIEEDAKEQNRQQLEETKREGEEVEFKPNQEDDIASVPMNEDL